jgi:hypothetical protein
LIPKADIVAWRQFSPWANDAQVEQDLIISRALVAIFQNPVLAERLAFRSGSTRRLATHNRYFEKIDMVAESVEAVFDSWSKPNPTLKKLCAII